MPRVARHVFVGVPHHITQRGNRREQVFFSDADRKTYLALLHSDSRRYGLEVLAYCLMANHVHLVAVPTIKRSMEDALRHVHMCYAQRLNRMHGWKGHVWQGRFFAAALDEPYCWSAIRYVERNPVRAGIVARAEDYSWSSAAAHCQSAWDPLLTDNALWTRQWAGIGNWSSWLSAGDVPLETEIIRMRTARGIPCGAERFVGNLERLSGRIYEFRGVGRPRRPA